MVDVEGAKRAFIAFYAKLTETLPMNLLAELYANGLLPGNLKTAVESLSTNKEKAHYFLDRVIKPSLNIGYIGQFNKMITFMESSDDPVVNYLAKQIQECAHGVSLSSSDDSESFEELYLRAIKNLGSEELQLCKVVFFGPPGVGKSSLVNVLMETPEMKLNQERNSTGLFDLKLVQFKVMVIKDDEKSESFWNTVTLNNEIERLRCKIEAKLKSQKQKSSNEQLSFQDVSLANAKKNIHKEMCQCLPDSPTQKRTYRTSNIIIALYDSGGQPEFFDIMPLLNTVPTGNVMIFNMNELFNAKIRPQFYTNGCHESTGNETHYTNAELMKTALANIESCVTRQTSPVSSNVIVVGTHLDVYMKGKENVEESLSQVDDALSKMVLTDSTRGMVVTYNREGKEDRIIHPISNTECSKKQYEVAQKIRTAIEEMSERANTQKEIPNSWLLFQYQIRLLNKPCITLNECQDIAKICFMKEDVKKVLKYFHDLGMLLNYKELEDVVFCNPQWLFEQLSKLIRAKYSRAYRADVENGIINVKFMADKIYSSLNKDTSGVIKLNDLLRLFVSLNIMAELPKERWSEDKTDRQFFMPALLDTASENPSLSEFGQSFYDTMYIMYKDTLFPRGMFCSLVTLLTQDQKNFELKKSMQCMFKNLIVFQKITDKTETYLILRDKISFMTIEVYQKEKFNLLQEIYCDLLEALQEVCERMNLKYQFKFGFACQEKTCEEKNHKDGTTSIAIVKLEYNFCPKAMRCMVCSKSVLLKYDQLLWFVPLKVLDVLQIQGSDKHQLQQAVEQPAHLTTQSSVKGGDKRGRSNSRESSQDATVKRQKSDFVDNGFDFADAAKKLRKQINKLSSLNYGNMERSLYACKVITAGERTKIKSKVGDEKMEYLIVDIIIPSLNQKFSKKYKGFLEAMEDSEDIDLQDTAKMLGGSQSVPDDKET